MNMQGVSSEPTVGPWWEGSLSILNLLEGPWRARKEVLGGIVSFC